MTNVNILFVIITIIQNVISQTDFLSPSSINIGGMFDYDDTTSQYAFTYAIDEYSDLFEQNFNISLNGIIEETGLLSTPGMDAIDSVSRLLNNNSIVGIIGFETSLDIVVTSDTLDEATVNYHIFLLYIKQCT